LHEESEIKIIRYYKIGNFSVVCFAYSNRNPGILFFLIIFRLSVYILDKSQKYML